MSAKIYKMIVSTILLFLTALTVPVINTGPLKFGDRVPDFEALDDHGTVWKLSEQRYDYLVIYFYPGAFMEECTKQACTYRDHETGFKLLKTQIIGISGDTWENLARFKEQHNLNFTLLSDKDGRIATLFGVPVTEGGTIETEVKGNTLSIKRGVTTARQTIVLDVNGKIIHREDKAEPENDSETVLKYIFTYNQRRSCTNF